MIIIKSDQEVDLMRESGKVTGFILKELENFIKPGISTADINRFVEDTIRKNGMIPTFKGYCGFPASACVSINEEVVHGIPDKKRILKEGDIVSVDVGSTYKGYVSDAARTYPVGKVSDIAQKLMDATRDSFFAGLEFCKVGYRLSDISHAIQVKAESDVAGFFIVIYERLCFFIVYFDSVSCCLCIVISSLNQGCSAFVTYAFYFRRYVYDVERCAACLADSSACKSYHQFVFIYIDIENVIDFLALCCQELIQFFCLENSSRESVEKESVLAVISLESVCCYLYNQFIWNQFTLVHILLCFFTKLSAFFDVGSENVASRNMRDIVFFYYFSSLSALSCSRRAQ